MISKEHRFSGPSGLRFIYKNGATAKGPLFSIKAVLNKRRQTYRAAVVVSRKVNKSAVVRNRIRRQLYEAVRSIEKDIDGPYDIAINVFDDGVVTQSADSLKQKVVRQLNQLGVLAKRLDT